MRYYLFPFFGCILFLLANTNTSNTSPNNFLNDCLELPDTPYNYSNIELPLYYNVPPIQDALNTPADNPTTDAGATLGRVLFYDKKLSLTNSQSCADCHKQSIAFTDDSQFSRGFEGGFTGRNSMNLNNARFYGPESFFWDQRAATLEEQILQPIQDPVEMGLTLEELVTKLEETEYYPPLFEEAFGSTEITADKIAKATAQFIRSMVSFQSKYDIGREMVFPNTPETPFPNFTESENLGKLIFFDAQLGGCASCHGTDAFIAPEARNNGLDVEYEDNGVGAVTGQANQNGLFKVPSLRNVELTGPFMHDGRFETLEEVIEHYSTGVQNHPNLSPQLRVAGPMSPPKLLNLSDEDKTALIDFLKTLTDFQFITDERWSDPFCFNPVDTEEEQFEASFMVYPNPTSQMINIEIDNTSGTNYPLRFINVQGQVVRTGTMRKNIEQLNIEDLPEGIYFLHLHAEGKQLVKKIICRR